MKTFELFYLIGIFFIILSIAFYILSTTLITNPEDHSVSNLFGEKTQIDSVFTSEEAITDVRTAQRYKNTIILWIGVPLGIVIFLVALILKRRSEGADLFIDDEIEDDEENGFATY